MTESQKHFIPEGLGEKVIGHDIWKFTNSDSDVMTITFDPKAGDHPFSIAAHGDVFCGDLNVARLKELKADITNALKAQKYYKVAAKRESAKPRSTRGGTRVVAHGSYESRAKRLSTRLTISKHGGASRRCMMRQPEHWSGKHDRPTAAGVIGFVLLLAIIPEFVLPFVFESVGAHTVGIILIVLTILGLYACVEELEKQSGKHKPEDEWTASNYWGDEQ